MNKLYDIQFHETFGDDVLNFMYCRSDRVLTEKAASGQELKKATNYDFFTYFNALSIEKWRRYTRLKNFWLVIEAKGDFDLYVFGHYQISTGVIKKEYYRKQTVNSDVIMQIIVPIPEDIKGEVIGFSVYANQDTYISEAYWATDCEGIDKNEVNIALSTTTFEKENYIRKNIEVLTKGLFSKPEYARHFHWFIVDNGRTLDSSISNEYISLISNPNLGGAGGFARGMMESIKAGVYTHVLLMDDDVVMTIESFKRLYILLLYLKKEYQGNFISGAMLKIEEPNVQHEDIGVFDTDGRHRPAKPMLDLNYWDSIVKNEKFLYDDGLHYYAGWWFCCIPMQYIRTDNLPLPVFVRGDDVEYSLRNNPGFISLNGICIWHEGFEGKFSGAMEFYQVERNELILNAISEKLLDVDVIGRVERFFWEEMYKFNYKGAALLLDAVEDYLSGPEYVFSLDGGKVMQEKKRLDNTLTAMTEDITTMFCSEVTENSEGVNDFYEWKPIEKRITKLIYDYTYNGQARIPEFILRKRIGIIPYGWGYFPQKMCMADEIYAIELRSNRYVKFTRDRKKFRELKKRHRRLMQKYQIENGKVTNLYKEAFEKQIEMKTWEQRTHSNKEKDAYK